MHFTTIITSFALALSASAAPTPAPPADTRYAQLRLFSAPGCFDLNQGELGVYGDYVNKCNTFGATTVESVSFEYAINNCTREYFLSLSFYFSFKMLISSTVQVYSDLECHLDRHDVPLQTCLSGDKEYSSYKVLCSKL